MVSMNPLKSDLWGSGAERLLMPAFLEKKNIYIRELMRNCTFLEKHISISITCPRLRPLTVMWCMRAPRARATGEKSLRFTDVFFTFYQLIKEFSLFLTGRTIIFFSDNALGMLPSLDGLQLRLDCHLNKLGAYSVDQLVCLPHYNSTETDMTRTSKGSFCWRCCHYFGWHLHVAYP